MILRKFIGARQKQQLEKKQMSFENPSDDASVVEDYFWKKGPMIRLRAMLLSIGRVPPWGQLVKLVRWVSDMILT